MGWLEYDIYEPVKTHLDKKWTTDIMENNVKTGHYKVLRSCLRGNTYYAAIELDHKEEHYVFALVCLTYYNPRAKGFNFAYKNMSEDMGPYKYDCPKTILNLLTPTKNKYANEWREKCWENAHKKEKLAKVEQHGKIKFMAEWDTTAANKGDTIELTKQGRSWYGLGYRWSAKQIPNNFEIIK